MVDVNPNIGAGQFLVGQYDPNLSSELGVLAANSGDLVDGTILSKFTSGGSSGKLTPLNPAGSTGETTFVGILYGARKTSAADQRVVIVVRKQVVNANMLAYKNTVSGPQKATIEAAMSAAHVIPRY